MKIEQDKAVHISVLLDKLKFKIESGALSITDIRPIQHTGLKMFLDFKRIPLDVAKKYLKELCLYNKNSKKHFYTFGFKNDEGGYHISNEVFNGYIDERGITSIEGSSPNSKGIHVFKDCWDFMSVIAYKKEFKLPENAIVINNYSLWQQIPFYIYPHRHKVIYSWLANSKTSLVTRQSLTNLCNTENGLRHRPMNEVYMGHRTISDWWTHKLPNNK